MEGDIKVGPTQPAATAVRVFSPTTLSPSAQPLPRTKDSKCYFNALLVCHMTLYHHCPGLHWFGWHTIGVLEYWMLRFGDINGELYIMKNNWSEPWNGMYICMHACIQLLMYLSVHPCICHAFIYQSSVSFSFSFPIVTGTITTWDNWNLHQIMAKEQDAILVPLGCARPGIVEDVFVALLLY